MQCVSKPWQKLIKQMSSCSISEQQKAKKKTDKIWNKWNFGGLFYIFPYQHIKLYVARWDEVMVSVCASECDIRWKSWSQKYWYFIHWLRADKETNGTWFLFLQIQTTALEPILALTEASAASMYCQELDVPRTPLHAYLPWNVAKICHSVWIPK